MDVELGTVGAVRVVVYGMVKGKEISLTLENEPGEGTVEAIKKKVFNEFWVKTGAFYMRAVSPTPGVLPVRVSNREALSTLIGYHGGEIVLEAVPLEPDN